jgi:sodium/bile acid cotransporter 7
MRRPVFDGFFVSILCAVALAVFFPQMGLSTGLLSIGRLTGIAVTLVFFLHGAVLPLEALREGFRNYRLHLVVISSTYVIFPFIGLLIFRFGQGHLLPPVALGFFFMSAVSSTISSSIAMTAMAGGDVAGALFNATLSGIVGVFLTPAYTSVMAHTAGIPISLVNVVESVSLKVLLPLALGQFARPLLITHLLSHPKIVQGIDRSSIVLIVYGAFCESTAAGVWTRSAIVPVLLTCLISAGLLALIGGSVVVLSRVAGLGRKQFIAAYFCGSQKSLANGLPIAHTVFVGSPAMGLIVMPLLVYHQVQLAVGAYLARRFGEGHADG